MRRVGHESARDGDSFCAPRLGSRDGVGWKGDRQKPAGASLPTPRKVASLEHRPQMLGPPDLTQVLAEAGQLGCTASSPSSAGQDLPIPLSLPIPRVSGCGPRPTHVECVPRHPGTFREKCVPRLQASQPRQSLGVPRGLAAPRANPSPSLARGWGREGPVPSGARSRRIQNVFSTQPGTTSFRPRRPDPRFGSESGIRSGPAPEVAQRPGGYACGSSPRRRAGWLRRLLRPGVDYNGSLLCLGHFKEKFSSMNIQPASLAHG